MGGFPFFGGRDFDDRFRGCGFGCGGGCGFDGFDGGRGCGCGFRDRFKTKFFNIRGCVAERCGRDGFDGFDGF